MTGINADFLKKEALLALDAQNKVTAGSDSFLRFFGLDTLPLGIPFDTLFDMTGDNFKADAEWQPFCAVLRTTGQKAQGIMKRDDSGCRMLFFEDGICMWQNAASTRDERLSLLVRHMSEGVALCRLVFKEDKAVDYVIEDINDGFADLFDLKRENAVGQLASILFNTGKAPFIKMFARVVQSEKPSQFDAFYAGLGKHFLISVTPWDKFRFGTVVSDLSQSRHSQLLYKALNEAAASISNAAETGDVFSGTARVLKKSGFECMMLLLDNDAVITQSYQSFGQQQHMTYTDQVPTLGSLYHRAVAQRRSVYIENLGMPDALKEAGLCAGSKCIAAPLIVNGKMTGLFVVMSCGIKQRDMDAVTAFANQLSAMMEKAALIQDLRAHIVKLEMSRKAHQDVAERLEMASRASRVGIWDVDIIRNVEYIDAALEKIYGIEPGEFDGSMASWRKFVHPDDIRRVAAAYRETLRSGRKYETEFRIILGDGSVRHISSMGILHRNKAGEPVRLVGTDWDITERKNAEMALKAEKELLATTLKSIGDGVVVTDDQGRITMVNAQFEQLCGFMRGQMNARMFGDVIRLHNDESEGSSGFRLIDKTLRTGRIVSHTGRELLRRDGRVVPVAYTASPIKNESGQICGSVLVMRDITEEKKKQKKIDYLAYHDALTGVYNRRYFDQMLKKLDTPDNLPISILSCDVNGLKLTNDAFGHGAGDKLLRRMASIMTKVCRKEDIVARVGGDEFFILMPRTDEDTARRISTSIKELAKKGQTYAIDESISVGQETKTRPEETLGTVIKKAESKMYRVKTFEAPERRDNSISIILQTLHQKRPHERAHARHVSVICCGIAKKMGLSDHEIAEIKVVGLMHDIGKVAIPDAIFSKKGKLTDEEYSEVKRHCEIGFRILSASVDMAHIAKIVLAHHERFDGTGYSSGMRGEEIPLQARIVAVADAYDAMTSERPYRQPIERNAALKEIAENKGTQFDPAVADAFLRMMNADV